MKTALRQRVQKRAPSNAPRTTAAQRRRPAWEESTAPLVAESRLLTSGADRSVGPAPACRDLRAEAGPCFSGQ